MAKNLSVEQRKLDVDLWIILIISVAVLGIYMAFQTQIINIVKDPSIHLPLRLLLAASFQFGLAGLGIRAIELKKRNTQHN